jgi:hypothetical protein
LGTAKIWGNKEIIAACSGLYLEAVAQNQEATRKHY